MKRPTLMERCAFGLSSKRVRECVQSLRAAGNSEYGEDDWKLGPAEAHRTRCYPMGFCLNDPNLYAIGWGTRVRMSPWERWLVTRTFVAVALKERRQ